MENTEIIYAECECCHCSIDQEELLWDLEQEREVCKTCFYATPEHQQYLNIVKVR